MLSYFTHGANSSPPIMIIHGLYGSGRNWGVIAKRLSDKFYVVTIDLRNHGESPWFDSHNYHDMADDLVEVITSLKIRPNIIGHSMGGMIVQEITKLIDLKLINVPDLHFCVFF